MIHRGCPVGVSSRACDMKVERMEVFFFVPCSRAYIIRSSTRDKKENLHSFHFHVARPGRDWELTPAGTSAHSRLFAQVDFRREKRPIAFVDPDAFPCTDVVKLPGKRPPSQTGPALATIGDRSGRFSQPVKHRSR